MAQGSLANYNYANSIAVTPSDVTPLAQPCRALYIGGTGAVKVTTIDGTSVTFSAVPVGTLLPVQCSLVFATGTTATLIIALW
jgi:hypothetical protein